jgi:hypothetical protein
MRRSRLKNDAAAAARFSVIPAKAGLHFDFDVPEQSGFRPSPE